MMIFQDLRVQGEASAEILSSGTTAEVESLCPEDLSVSLDRPCKWSPDSPIYYEGRPLPVVHADHDSMWLDNLDTVHVGAKVSQQAMLGKPEDVFTAFAKVWTPRWERHRHVPASQWQQILDFAHAHLPRRQIDWPDLDSSALAACIAKKKKHTARGLDGVSLTDLAHMPPQALQNFCDMFGEAQQTGSWPPQLINGRVTAVPKHGLACIPEHFRPITVFGLLYRCWTSWRAHQALVALDADLPPGLYGSRPRRFAGQLWTKLLWALEAAHVEGIKLGGVIADLSKAFNCLPRLVVAESLAIMGLPFRVLRGWIGAVSEMQSCFQVESFMGPLLPSSTGFAEGDAMSVVGMVAVDVLLDRWLAVQHPLACTLTYVDDWQVVTNDSASIHDLVDSLVQFTALTDLALDRTKTFVWSLCSDARATLRRQNLLVSQCGRSLGAHLQLSKKHTNMTLTQRFKDLQPLWPKLKISPSPYPMKLRAIRAAAWPRALSTEAFRTLRSAAMKSLGATAAGASPLLHLGLVENPLTDPSFWAISQTLKDARQMGPHSQVKRCLAAIGSGTYTGPNNSVGNTLAVRLKKLGWQLLPDGRLRDHAGLFDFLAIGGAELSFRMELAWPYVVAQQMHLCSRLQGIEFVDAGHTRRWMRQLCVSSQGAFRKVLNATHMTQDCKVHCQEQSTDQCPWCECSDSRFHRFWLCPQFVAQRSGVDAAILAGVPSLPETLTAYGWSLRPATYLEWFRYFNDLPVPDIALPTVPLPAGILHIFTDGACHDPAHAAVRYAAWGFAVIEVGQDTTPLWSQSGVLPGLLQSVYRCEVFAVLMALKFGNLVQRPVHIWCDCAAAVGQLRRILAGEPIKLGHPHSDLWSSIERLIYLLGPQNVQVTKVASHVEAALNDSVLEVWCSEANAHVDSLAVSANAHRGSQFHALHARHVQACNLAHKISRQVQTVILNVSLAALKLLDQVNEFDCDVDAPEPAQVQVPVWTPLPTLACLPAGAVRWYGDELVRWLMSWWWQSLRDSEAPVQWISHFQLYIDFQCSTGRYGPTHVRNKWAFPANDALPGLVEYPFKQRCRWFMKTLNESLRHAGASAARGFVRPASHYLCLHCGCVAVPWPLERLRMVDAWLQGHLNRSATRCGSVLQSLPVACRDDRFEEILLSDVSVQ